MQKEFIEKGNTYKDLQKLLSIVSLELYAVLGLELNETYKQFLVKIEEEDAKATQKAKEAQDKKMSANKYPPGGQQITGDDELNMTNQNAGIPSFNQ